MELLDRLGTVRYDVRALVESASRFGDLDPSEQDEYLNVWDYAGLLEAEHPLTNLVPEGGSPRCVVRDLDGSLHLLWEEPGTSRWEHAPLTREDLVDEVELAEALEDPEWLPESDLSALSRDELVRVLAALPAAEDV